MIKLAVASRTDPFCVDQTTLAHLRESFAQRGVAVLTEPALKTDWWRKLCEEARGQRLKAAWHLLSERNAGEISQNNMRGHLGPNARGLLASSRTRSLLHAVTTRRLKPSWSASCYTYYDKAGSYMGEHCDKYEACRIAMLVYLEAQWPEGRSPGHGLRLYVFKSDSSQAPLAASVTAHPNRVVILDGASQAHVRPPLAEGESILMLAGCFQVAS
jgi:hypothetical protein